MLLTILHRAQYLLLPVPGYAGKIQVFKYYKFQENTTKIVFFDQ